MRRACNDLVGWQPGAAPADVLAGGDHDADTRDMADCESNEAGLLLGKHESRDEHHPLPPALPVWRRTDSSDGANCG